MGLGVLWVMLMPAPFVLGGEDQLIKRSIPANGDFIIEFSNAMDQPSVENAIATSPQIEGDFVWESNSKLRLVPESELTEGNEILFTINSGALDWLGKSTEQAVTFSYVVTTAPKVTMLSPISANDWTNLQNARNDDEARLEPEAAFWQRGEPITVMFDRPMRALSNNDEEVEEEKSRFLPYLKTEPPIPGKIRTLGTSAFEFYPDTTAWPEAREITVTLLAGIQSIDGGTTTEDISWKLRTEAPKLVSVKVGDVTLNYNDETKTFSGENILPDSFIALEWNMPIDTNSFFAQSELTPERPVKNDTIKRGDQKNNLIFWDFDPALVRGETIEVITKKGVEPLHGEFVSEDPYRIRFETLKEPCVRIAGNKETNQVTIDPNGKIELDFCTLTSWWDTTLQENRSMEDALLDHLSVNPTVDMDEVSVGCWSTICELWLPSKPGDQFEIRFTPGLTDVFGQAVDTESFSVIADIDDYPPMLRALTRNRERSVYDSSEPVDIYFTARNVQNMRFVTCVVPPAEVRRIEGEGGWNWNNYSCANQSARTVSVPGETNETKVFGIPLLGEDEQVTPGTVYFWEAVSDQVRSPWNDELLRFSGVVYPMNAALSVQHSEDFITAWATDFAEGRPISGMQVSLVDSDGNIAGAGQTDERGLLTLQKPEDSDDFFLEGRKGDLSTFVGLYWNDGIAPWDFGFSYDWRDSPGLTGILLTDRPIYRPGDTVQFKGILRRDVDAIYELPPEDVLFVTIENSRGETMYESELALDEFGTLADELNLSAQATTGMYRIDARTSEDGEWSNSVSGVFWVEEYKKPDYKVAFHGDQEEYVSGESLDITIATEYFFGSPVKNADVEWHIVASPLYFDRWSGGGWFSFGTDEQWCWWYCEDGQEVIQRGSGNTGDAGEMQISIPLDTETHQFYTLTATAIDSNGRTVSANKTYPVFSGKFVLGVRTTDFWLDENAKQVKAEALATDLQGRPLTGKKFSATLQNVTWNSIKKQDVDGNFYWENTQEFTELDTTTASTNIGGKVEITFPLKDEKAYYGDLRTLLTAKDEKGNTVEAADRIWRSSSQYSSPSTRQNHDRIDLIAETPEVAPGETIRLLPASPFNEDVWAFVSVGRKQAVYRDVFLWQAGTPIEITATKEMVPNTFAIVTLFKGRGDLFRIRDQVEEYQNLAVEVEAIDEQLTALQKKRSTITESLLDDKSEELVEALGKGLETVNRDIDNIVMKKADIADRRAGLEEAIRLVMGADASIPEQVASHPYPEAKVGIAPIKVSAESRRLRLKITPNQAEYLPGQDVALTIMATDSFGNPVENADLSIAVVDESLLALKSRQDEDVFEVFFRMRDIGVRLASSMVAFINRLDVDTAKGQKGGGGESDLELLQKKRGDFRDTAFWLANLRTDINGEAATGFILPDNVTSWQVWVTANTQNSHFGSSKMNFFSRKPLVITPLLPRFLIAGDTATIGATITNRDSDELIVRAAFEGENVEIITKDAESFRLDGDGETTLFYTIRAQASEETPLAQLAPAVFTFSVQGDTETAVDSVEYSIPIKAPAVGESIATSGYLGANTNAVQEKVVVPGGVLKDVGQIFIGLTAGAVGDLATGIAALTQFPYGCTEQIVSAQLPNVALLRLNDVQGDQLDIGDFDTITTRKMIETGVQSLYEHQNPDGGFGFWQNSETSYPYLTAYTLFSMEQTAERGITVDEDIRKRARAYLRQKVWEDLRNGATDNRPEFPNNDARAFAMYALSFGESFDESMLSQLYERRSQMSAEGKAFVMLTAQQVLNADPSPMASALLRELEQDAVQTDREAYFSGGEYSWNFGSDVRSTAIVLLAILREDTEHPLLPKIMEYLRDKKQSSARYAGSPWGTTQNTAWVLFALIEFLQANPLEAANVTVAKDMQQILSDRLDSLNRTSEVSIPIAQANTGITTNSIDINKSGGGISYDIVANYFLPVDRVTARNHGLGVFRELFAFEDTGKKTPINSAEQSALIRGRTTILVPENRYFVGVRIPIPAGTEAVNFALETEDQSLRDEVDACVRYWCPDNDSWRFEHKEYRDDHIFLFAEYLPAGRYEFNFLLRANVVGKYQLLPAVAEEIYHPETSGRSAGNMFEVKARTPSTTPATSGAEE